VHQWHINWSCTLPWAHEKCYGGDLSVKHSEV
jgi:hypothetical protein